MSNYITLGSRRRVAITVSFDFLTLYCSIERASACIICAPINVHVVRVMGAVESC
jgi:hypothetical protein